jgi:hypothetical protein
MVVREATRADMPWLLDQLADFDRFFGAKLSLLHDVEEARQLMDGWIEAGPVFVAEHDGQPIGFIVGSCGPHYLSSRITALFEILWWAPPTRQGKRALTALLDAFTAFGEARRVDWIICSRQVRQPATPTFRKRGFRTLELSHVKELT